MSASTAYKIAVVIPYFGRLPVYFDLWKKSAAFNSFIDFILVTDITSEQLTALPHNIKLISMTLEDLTARAESRLGVPVALQRAYKLCDLKPAYGKIFEDEIRSYDFWGYGDLDVIWGDLRKFFSSDLFHQYDRIQEIGHLTFLRNTDTIRNLYARPADGVDYKSIFANPASCLFDEFGGFDRIVRESGIRQIWHKNYIDVAFDRFQLIGHYIDNFEHQIFYWEQGKLIREHMIQSAVKGSEAKPKTTITEFAYIHLQKRPMIAPDFNVDAIDAFFITPDRFIEKKTSVHSLDDFKRLNRKAIRQPYFSRRIKVIIYPIARPFLQIRNQIRLYLNKFRKLRPTAKTP